MARRLALWAIAKPVTAFRVFLRARFRKTILLAGTCGVAKSIRDYENRMMMAGSSALNGSQKLARWIFILAAVYGVPVLGSWFFITPHMLGRASTQQPEIYYGFAGLGLAWQAVFLLIAYDPVRYRPLMLFAAIGEKILFVVILIVLFVRHIAQPHWIPPAVMDFIFGLAFIVAYIISAPKSSEIIL